MKPLRIITLFLLATLAARAQTARTNYWRPYGDTSVSLSSGYRGLDLSLTTNNAALLGLGDYAFSNSTLAGNYDVTGIGPFDMADAEIRNSHFLYGYGPSSFQAARVLSSFGMTGLGLSIFATSSTTNCHYLVGAGNAAFEYARNENSYDLFAASSFGALSAAWCLESHDVSALGYEAMYGAHLTGSAFINAWGDLALASSTLSASSNVVAVGTRALAGANLADSVDVLALGTEAGAHLSGALTNVVLLGARTQATNANEFVLGNEAASYVMPGGSISANWIRAEVIAAATNLVLTLGGKTYRIPVAP